MRSNWIFGGVYNLLFLYALPSVCQELQNDVAYGYSRIVIIIYTRWNRVL